MVGDERSGETMAQEKNFENKIKAELKNRGAWFVKYWGGGEFTKAGVPDILCCYKGRFIGIEVKASKGKLSELQRYNLKKIDEADGVALCLFPQDFEEFKVLLNLIDKGNFLFESAYADMKERWW